MRYHQGGIIKPAVLQKVTALIAAGSSISSLTKTSSPNYIVKFSTLARCRRENSEFGRLVADASKDSNSRGQLRRWRKIKNDVVREQNNDYHRIRSMIPENNPHRGDIVGRIFEDMLSGSLKREDVRSRVNAYIAEFNRLYPTKYAKFGDSQLVSLDEVLFGSGSTTKGDSVSRGLWD
jgi:hypothetical protein